MDGSNARCDSPVITDKTEPETNCLSTTADPNHLRVDAEQDIFDSGNYSENDPGGIGGGGDTSSSVSAPAVVQLPGVVIASPAVKRRTTTYEDGSSEEYLYFPSSSVTKPLPMPSVVTATPTRLTPTGPTSSSHLQSLFQNFNFLYNQKLEEADSMSKNFKNGDSSEIKLSIMQDWIRDLNEQNKVLIDTIDEMEKEAEEKIQLLQVKVQKSAEMLMNHMTIIQEYELQVQRFMNRRDETEKQLQMFYEEAEDLGKKKKQLEQKLQTLENEHACLLKLLTRIRDWGVWDISGLDLNPRTFKHLFDLYPNLPGSEVQTVFTKERAREVLENEKKLRELGVECDKLKDHQASIEKLNFEKERLIASLQKERDELQIKISGLEIESIEHRRRLEETQEQLNKTIIFSRDSNSERAEIEELVTQLKQLKDELHNARSERHSAMMEAVALKQEMGQHLSDLTQMKSLLLALHAESEITKEQVREVQDKQCLLAALEDQVKFSQERYNETNETLSMKSSLIDRLQNEVDKLHEKVTKLECAKIPLHKQIASAPNLSKLVKSNKPNPPLPVTNIESLPRVDKTRQLNPIIERSSVTQNKSKWDPHSIQSHLRPARPSWSNHFNTSKKLPDTPEEISGRIPVVRRPKPGRADLSSPRSPKMATVIKPQKFVVSGYIRGRGGTPEVKATVSNVNKSPAQQGQGTRRIEKKEGDRSSRSSRIAKYFSERFGILLEEEERRQGKESSGELKNIDVLTEVGKRRWEDEIEKFKLPPMVSSGCSTSQSTPPPTRGSKTDTELEQSNVEIGRWVSNQHDKTGTVFVPAVPALLLEHLQEHSSILLEVNHNNNIPATNQPDLLISINELQSRLHRLEIECQDKNIKIMELNTEAKETKQLQLEMSNQIKSKDIEIQMQKLTINHLQNALVALKRGSKAEPMIPMDIPSLVVTQPKSTKSGGVFDI